MIIYDMNGYSFFKFCKYNINIRDSMFDYFNNIFFIFRFISFII